MLTRSIGALLILFLPLASVAAAAGDDGSESKANVSVTIHMGKLDGERKTPVKSYQLLFDGHGDHSELLIGKRIAIPVTRFQVSESGESVPITSYTYQNVGFTAAGEARILPDGRVKLNLAIEDSHLIEPTDAQPAIGTRNQKVRAVVRPGVPIEINRIDDPALGSEYCEVVVEVSG